MLRTFCTAGSHKELTLIWLLPITPTTFQVPYEVGNGALLFAEVFLTPPAPYTGMKGWP